MTSKIFRTVRECCFPPITAAMFLACAVASQAAAHDNPVFEQLIAGGDDALIRLPPPQFPDELSGEEQRQRLAEAAGPRHSLDEMLRPSPLAPHVLVLERTRRPEQAAVQQRVSVVFALKGDLDAFADESFLEALLGGDEDPQEDGEGEVRPLTPEELAAAGIDAQANDLDAPDPDATALGREHFRLVRGELFSRVRFSGVIRSMATRTEHSLLTALQLDDRFVGVPGLAPRWQRLQRDDAGVLRPAEEGQLLSGGAYVKVTRMHDDPSMLIFEAEFQFLEPEAWFRGANFLGSKLPPAIQSQVRQIRRTALRALES